MVSATGTKDAWSLEGAASWAPGELDERLRRCVATGRLEGLELEHWLGDGPPPPLRRYHHLRLVPGRDDGSVGQTDDREAAPDTIEFTHPRPEPGTLPSPLLRHRVEARPADISAFAQALLDARAFDPTGGSAPRSPDALTLRIGAAEGGRRALATHHDPLPGRLSAVGRAAAELIERAVDEGTTDVVRLR